MVKESGVLIETPWDGGRQIHEPTVACVHCGAHHVVYQAFERAILGKLGFCSRCNGITCGKKCQTCVPAEKWLDRKDSNADPASISVAMGAIR